MYRRIRRNKSCSRGQRAAVIQGHRPEDIYNIRRYLVPIDEVLQVCADDFWHLSDY